MQELARRGKTCCKQARQAKRCAAWSVRMASMADGGAPACQPFIRSGSVAMAHPFCATLLIWHACACISITVWVTWRLTSSSFRAQLHNQDNMACPCHVGSSTSQMALQHRSQRGLLAAETVQTKSLLATFTEVQDADLHPGLDNNAGGLRVRREQVLARARPLHGQQAGQGVAPGGLHLRLDLLLRARQRAAQHLLLHLRHVRACTPDPHAKDQQVQ